jgi:hypothetical protein
MFVVPVVDKIWPVRKGQRRLALTASGGFYRLGNQWTQFDAHRIGDA